MLKDYYNTFENKGMKFLLIQLNKPLESACQLILIQVTYTIVTNFAQCFEFISEFKSTWAKILKQLFDECQGKVNE